MDVQGATLLQAKAPIILEPPKQPAQACVIWLHGLGADGHDFEGLLPHLGLPEDHGIRFVFPNAPVRPVTINLGEPMTAWYDIRSIHLMEQVDWAGIDASVAQVHDWIRAQQAQGLSSERILLAGFSQGGVIVLQAGLRFESPLAGIMGLSTYFPHQTALTESYVQPLATPIFLAHGTADPICPFTVAEHSRSQLQSLGRAPQWHVYPGMPHQVCADEIQDMARFIQASLL